MYRIFCDSCKNYLSQFSDDREKADCRKALDDREKADCRKALDDGENAGCRNGPGIVKKAEYRIGIALPIALLCDAARYTAEKESESIQYKQLSDLLFHMEQNVSEYPAVKAFLWTLVSRGMSGKPYGTVSRSDLDEQVKLVIMLLKLMYWEEAD